MGTFYHNSIKTGQTGVVHKMKLSRLRMHDLVAVLVAQCWERLL